jgi:hypothetical protein
LWKLFPLPQDLRPGFTWTLSILFLLAGFLIASYQQLESLSRRAEKDREDLLAEVGRIAAGNGLRAMTADDALREIASKLPAARAIWNTRISEKLPNEPMVTPVRREYDAALRRAVIDEGVSYREVLAPSWESTVCAQFAVRTRRATALASSVNLSVVQAPTPSFVNFIVIEYKDRTQEMYWGWAISRNRGPEQECGTPSSSPPATRSRTPPSTAQVPLLREGRLVHQTSGLAEELRGRSRHLSFCDRPVRAAQPDCCGAGSRYRRDLAEIAASGSVDPRAGSRS